MSTNMNPVMFLALYLGKIAADAADEVLGGLDSKRLNLGPVIAYSVYEQCYFFFLHLTLRIALGSGGVADRDLVQDLLSPVIFRAVPPFLNARFESEADLILATDSLKVLEEEFWRRLESSEPSYSQEREYEGLKNQCAERLVSSLTASGVNLGSEFSGLFKQSIGVRGHNIGSLVEDVVKG